MKLRPDEQELRGTWKSVTGKMEADENCRRIEKLTQEYLHEIARDTSGSDVLFLDPSDGRYWELVYEDSGLHGGGAPKLTCLPHEEAKEKYGAEV